MDSLGMGRQGDFLHPIEDRHDPGVVAHSSGCHKTGRCELIPRTKA